MIRILLIVLAAVAALVLPAQAQDSLYFQEMLTPDTIIEGSTINAFISIHNPNFPSGFDTIYVEPPPSDPIYKSTFIFQSFEDSTYSFRFSPSYNLIDADTDFEFRFFATDLVDTISDTITIRVLDNNPKPTLVLSPSGPHRIVEGVPFTISASATDPYGSIPILETSQLPGNATFVDSANGKGAFFFTPDATQFGDSAQDTTVIFYARDPDTDSSAVITVTITVVGPNLPPEFVDPGPQTVVEGDLLSLTITATDTNNTPITLFTSDISQWPTMAFVDSGGGEGLFTFIPSFTWSDSASPTVTFYANDGSYEATLDVVITITDAGNQRPVFDDDVVTDTTFPEGGGTLVIRVSAHDPEGGEVAFLWLDSLENATFAADTLTPNTGIFTFSPGMNQGGNYTTRFSAVDDSLAADTMTLNLHITEINYPPTLTVFPATSQSMREGERLRIEWTAFDSLGEDITFTLFPPPDSSLFKGSMASVNYGDSGYLDFAPDYNFVRSGASAAINLKFSAADAWDTIRQERVITVYNVAKDPNDPGEADTLTMVGAYWTDSLVIDTTWYDSLWIDTIVVLDTFLVDTSVSFSLTTRIWNDSAIAAAITGFRWYDPWLLCDTVIFSSRLNDAAYKRQYIYNDSLMFQTTFIFFDSLYLPPGEGDYFTAYFKYNPEHPAVDLGSFHGFDSTKVGSNGEFYFDKRIRLKSLKEATDEDLEINLKSEFTYRPLINFGDIRHAYDSVALAVYDVGTGSILGRGDYLYMYDDTDVVKTYEFRVKIENRERLDTLSLGFRIFSNDGAVWTYDDPMAKIFASSRMFPDTEIWPGSSGLQVIGSGLDGIGADSIQLNGYGGPSPEAGLAPGLMENMVSIPFTVGGVTGQESKTICFDRAAINPSRPWLFVSQAGDQVTPGYGGEVCFPVGVKYGTAIDEFADQVPRTYRLDQNYPNPFNPSTTIRFTLPRSEHVKITIYNILGQVVKDLADKTCDAGEHLLIWDGRDNDGHQTASGIYLYHLESEGFTDTRKMVLLK